MKIACDVNGTLEGPKKQQVLKMLDIFSKAGYEITIWSNSYSYAVDAVKDNSLNALYTDKKTQGDLDFDVNKYYNIAIEDDRSQTWLAAKQFVFVDQIPEDINMIEFFVRELLEGQ